MYRFSTTLNLTLVSNRGRRLIPWGVVSEPSPSSRVESVLRRRIRRGREKEHSDGWVRKSVEVCLFEVGGTTAKAETPS